MSVLVSDKESTGVVSAQDGVGGMNIVASATRTHTAQKKEKHMIVEVEAGVELASCPFCGSKAVAGSDGWWNADTQRNTNATFWVKCANTKCSVSTLASSNQAEAIIKWNARQ